MLSRKLSVVMLAQQTLFVSVGNLPTKLFVWDRFLMTQEIRHQSFGPILKTFMRLEGIGSTKFVVDRAVSSLFSCNQVKVLALDNKF
jgi:hypothetical protein